jgi:hypothetical protein
MDMLHLMTVDSGGPTIAGGTGVSLSCDRHGRNPSPFERLGTSVQGLAGWREELLYSYGVRATSINLSVRVKRGTPTKPCAPDSTLISGDKVCLIATMLRLSEETISLALATN